MGKADSKDYTQFFESGDKNRPYGVASGGQQIILFRKKVRVGSRK